MKMQKWVISYQPSLILNFRTLFMNSKLELKLPKWICSYLRLFESSFSQQCDWKTKNAYVFQFSDIYLIPLLVFMFSSADNDILYQRQQASPDEFVSRPVRAIALCIPAVHHFRRKMHAHLHERKISCSFFFSQECMHLYCVSFYTKNARPSTRTEDFLFFFFSQEEKLWSPRKRTWRPTIHISCLQSSQELEEKYVPYNKQLSGKT